MNPVFEIRQSFTARVNFNGAVLSLADCAGGEEKKVSLGLHTEKGRLSIEGHVEALEKSQRIDVTKPTMVISARNVLANLRSGAWINGLTPEFLTVTGEQPALSRRPYHLLGYRKGSLELVEIVPSNKALQDFEWAISGVPVLWNDDSDLFERLATESADHSHVWRIPRGSHPEATNATRSLWDQIHAEFLASLHLKRAEAYCRIMKHAIGIPREDNYLHNVLGVDSDGQLVQIIANGRLEQLGKQLRSLGVSRAIMVDNGGSPVVRFYPKGLSENGTQLFAAPNHRPAGTAYIFLQLLDKKFSLL